MITLLLAAALSFQDTKLGEPFPVELKSAGTTYWAFIPEETRPTRTLPLIVLLHGAGDTADNFLKAWLPAAAKREFLLVAAKSKGQGWDDADGATILAILEDAKKRLPVDPERVILAGFSSGAHMASQWGFKHLGLWRAVCLLAGGFTAPGGKEYKAAVGRTTVLVCCGDKDQNMAGCKQIFDQVKKDGFDCENNWVPGMPHSPPKPEVWPWFLDQIEKRLDAPAERFKRGKKAVAAKRWADAIADFQAILDEKIAKQAAPELDKLEKAGNLKLLEGSSKLQSGDKAAAKKCFEEAAKYDGFECAQRARLELDQMK